MNASMNYKQTMGKSESERKMRNERCPCSLERAILGPKGIRQEIFKDSPPIGPIVVHKEDLKTLTKLVHKLSADATGCDEMTVVGSHRNSDKPSMAIGDRLDKRCPFGTDGSTVCGILDIAALEDLAVDRPKRRTDSEPRVRTVGCFPCFEGLGDEIFDLPV